MALRVLIYVYRLGVSLSFCIKESLLQKDEGPIMMRRFHNSFSWKERKKAPKDLLLDRLYWLEASFGLIPGQG